MEFNTQEVRAFVENLLTKTKSKTENEVKAAVAKAFKVPVAEVGAGVIREVRKAMGIDRPTAMKFVTELLAKDPLIEGRAVVNAVASKFGVRISPPDVSRLRPKNAKASRLKGRKSRRGDSPAAPSRRAARGAASDATRPAPGEARKPRTTGSGTISLVFDGSGTPEDLAAFFLSLGKGV